MIDATESIQIEAPAEQVAALYADVESWPRLFPATVRSAKVLRESPEEKAVEVDHVEGRVLNLLRPKSSTRFELDEFKRRYDATFVNAFVAEEGGTRYTLTAHVRLKGALRWFSPIARPLIRARMRRYVLEPMKAAAEHGPAH